MGFKRESLFFGFMLPCIPTIMIIFLIHNTQLIVPNKTQLASTEDSKFLDFMVTGILYKSHFNVLFMLFCFVIKEKIFVFDFVPISILTKFANPSGFAHSITIFGYNAY